MRVHLVNPSDLSFGTAVITPRWLYVLAYRQMYANTGIATDSARRGRSERWARWLAKGCRRLFVAKPMPHLEVPAPRIVEPVASI